MYDSTKKTVVDEDGTKEKESACCFIVLYDGSKGPNVSVGALGRWGSLDIFLPHPRVIDL